MPAAMAAMSMSFMLSAAGVVQAMAIARVGLHNRSSAAEASPWSSTRGSLVGEMIQLEGATTDEANVDAKSSINLVFEMPGPLVLDGTQGCLYNAEGAASDLPLGDSPYTVEAWISPASTITDGSIATWGETSWRRFQGWRLVNPGVMFHNWWGDNIGPLTLPQPLDDGEFHHVSITYDGTERKMFVDFVMVGEKAPSAPHELRTKDTFCVGGRYAGGNGEADERFIGTIRDVKIWSQARTSSEMQSSAQTTTTPSVTAPSSGTGDPHLQNMFGQRFDLQRQGTSVLVSIPRGTLAEDALLFVQADARRVGALCSDMYFQEINVTGTWAEKAQRGGFHYDVRGAPREKSEWVKLGPTNLKVGHGQTDSGVHYLNIYVKHLSGAGLPVGGLLGEDDYTEAAAPDKECQKTMSLMKGRAAHRRGSLAMAQ